MTCLAFKAVFHFERMESDSLVLEKQMYGRGRLCLFLKKVVQVNIKPHDVGIFLK